MILTQLEISSNSRERREPEPDDEGASEWGPWDEPRCTRITSISPRNRQPPRVSLVLAWYYHRPHSAFAPMTYDCLQLELTDQRLITQKIRTQYWY